MKILSILTVLILSLYFGNASPVLAQKWTIGPHIIVSLPQSDFANVSSAGGGIGIKGIYRVSKLGNLSIRSDFGFISYGSKLETLDNFRGVPNVVAETRNESFRLIFGPQVTFGSSHIKFNLATMGGFYFYRTLVTVPSFFGPISESRDDTAELGWSLGGGVQYDIGLGPWLDFAVEYHTIKNVPAPALEGAEGQTVNIDANDISLKFGVVFFIGR